MPPQAGQAAQPAPGKPPEAQDTPLSMSKIRLILQFGLKLVRLAPLYVAAYVLLNLVSQTAIPLMLPVLIGKLTNSVQPAGPTAGKTSAPQTQSSGAAAKPTTEPGRPRGSAEAADGRGDSVTAYYEWLALTLLFIPLSICFRLAQTKMDGKMEKEVRQGLFDKVIRQAPEFFHRYNPGELTNVLTQTSVEAQQALRSLTVDPLLQLASLTIAMALIVQQLRHINGPFIWPTVGLMIVFGVGSAWLIQRKSDKMVGRSQREAQMQRFALAGLADAAVKSAEEIQAMDAEQVFSSRHDEALNRMMKLKTGQTLTMEILNSAIGVPTQIIVACLFGLVVYQSVARTSGIPPGVFVTIAGLAPQLMQPFKSFAVLGVIASASWPAIELVTRMLKEENRIKDLPGARDIEKVEPTLEARSIKFGYVPGERKVFDDLTFSVPAAGITGFVARMGQGKTTFFRLAMRFYDPESGEILLGGFPTSSFTLRSLRRCAVIMSQFPAFFHDSVGENFRVAKPDATDEEIRALCERTRLWPILERAVGKDPLDKPFAAGMGISGGQKKLFALTRCLLRNPTFLFLDEPTTNMSNDEKYLLIPLMREACAGKTVIVVDHDLSWLTQFCDHFVVLDSGKIVQQGTAAELLAVPGVLNELYSLAHPA
jgi:ATP-binding cassette subfamily B protein